MPLAVWGTLGLSLRPADGSVWSLCCFSVSLLWQTKPACVHRSPRLLLLLIRGSECFAFEKGLLWPARKRESYVNCNLLPPQELQQQLQTPKVYMGAQRGFVLLPYSPGSSWCGVTVLHLTVIDLVCFSYLHTDKTQRCNSDSQCQCGKKRLPWQVCILCKWDYKPRQVLK